MQLQNVVEGEPIQQFPVLLDQRFERKTTLSEDVLYQGMEDRLQKIGKIEVGKAVEVERISITSYLYTHKSDHYREASIFYRAPNNTPCISEYQLLRGKAVFEHWAEGTPVEETNRFEGDLTFEDIEVALAALIETAAEETYRTLHVDPQVRGNVGMGIGWGVGVVHDIHHMHGGVVSNSETQVALMRGEASLRLMISTNITGLKIEVDEYRHFRVEMGLDNFKEEGYRIEVMGTLDSEDWTTRYFLTHTKGVVLGEVGMDDFLDIEPETTLKVLAQGMMPGLAVILKLVERNIQEEYPEYFCQGSYK